ncbi:hypothetical protein Pden_1155 [Paracoccus denitrificans PD1222]|uniref:Uncharacterized protein n=1 Tax=Paracoccus denitrificans (strain Pd 1222) TaxID=318586 RepID=A1B169_PARDP|nr:hypothetical protein Pden_1155 [Paracoccus denitrificans PD1222]
MPGVCMTMGVFERRVGCLRQTDAEPVRRVDRRPGPGSAECPPEPCRQRVQPGRRDAGFLSSAGGRLCSGREFRPIGQYAATCPLASFHYV